MVLVMQPPGKGFAIVVIHRFAQLLDFTGNEESLGMPVLNKATQGSAKEHDVWWIEACSQWPARDDVPHVGLKSAGVC